MYGYYAVMAYSSHMFLKRRILYAEAACREQRLGGLGVEAAQQFLKGYEECLVVEDTAAKATGRQEPRAVGHGRLAARDIWSYAVSCCHWARDTYMRHSGDAQRRTMPRPRLRSCAARSETPRGA